jgi:hypothetical protein
VAGLEGGVLADSRCLFLDRDLIYPDAAHGFLFQHHSEFAADVREFLDS